MPRTLDAALLAAMNSGNFTPYFNLQLMDSNKTTVLHSTTDIIRFEMQGLTAQVEYYDPAFSDDFYYFRLQRGITVAGVPNVITSSCFTSRHDRREKRVRSLAGHLIPPEHFSCAGDQTYKQVIDAVCANFGFTAVYAEPAAAYLSYQFYPTGRTLVLNDSKYFFTILRAKYLVFACDLGNEQIYFYQTKATYPTYPGGYTLITAKHISVPGQGARKYKSFLSRDESATIHLSGSATNPMHNLGFLHSTASHPARTWFVDTPDWVVQGISPNLKYLDFDSIRAVSDSAAWLLWPALFREI